PMADSKNDSKKTTNSKKTDKIRYAVVGVGHIAQAAAIPSFRNTDNCEVVALVSGDDAKLREVGDQYGIEHRIHYDEYGDFLQKGLFYAIKIALTVQLLSEYAVAAAEAGVHELCEKPMAVTVEH